MFWKPSKLMSAPPVVSNLAPSISPCPPPSPGSSNPSPDRMRHWLIKSEPDVFGIDDLQKVKREPWSGVRNYQARNFMWKEMKAGDLALFYHSNTKPPGVTGIA